MPGLGNWLYAIRVQLLHRLSVIGFEWHMFTSLIAPEVFDEVQNILRPTTLVVENADEYRRFVFSILQERTQCRIIGEALGGYV